jgi:hypothetical protein
MIKCLKIRNSDPTTMFKYCFLACFYRYFKDYFVNDSNSNCEKVKNFKKYKKAALDLGLLNLPALLEDQHCHQLTSTLTINVNDRHRHFQHDAGGVGNRAGMFSSCLRLNLIFY